MNGPRISVCRKLKAERTKAQQEKAYLAQGKGDKDHYGFLVDSDMESIDEPGWLADDPMDRGPNQLSMNTLGETRVTFVDHNKVIVCPEQHLTDTSEEVQHIHREEKS